VISLDRERQRFPYNNLKSQFPWLDDYGIELLNAFFAYDPSLRITARSALQHEYFNCSPYPKSEEFMPSFPSFHDNAEVMKERSQK
jgi:serine/threonine protein kinase